VCKIAEKAVYWSVFLTIWHCILSAELTKIHSFRLLKRSITQFLRKNNQCSIDVKRINSDD